MAVACEVQQQPRLPYTSLSVGIDMGLLHFATLSSEDTIKNSRYQGPHKDLDERTHTCVHCGLVLDRDMNAALSMQFS